VMRIWWDKRLFVTRTSQLCSSTAQLVATRLAWAIGAVAMLEIVLNTVYSQISDPGSLEIGMADFQSGECIEGFVGKSSEGTVFDMLFRAYHHSRLNRRKLKYYAKLKAETAVACSTSRPGVLYGVTCLWLPPHGRLCLESGPVARKLKLYDKAAISYELSLSLTLNLAFRRIPSLASVIT
jgi:hypothetical protein